MPKTKSIAAPKPRKPRAAKKRPTQEEIALRAYHIYLERNGAPGNPLEDWIRAERELADTQPAARKAAPRRKATVTAIAA